MLATLTLPYALIGTSFAVSAGLFWHICSMRKNIGIDISRSSVLDREYTKAKYDHLERQSKDYADKLHTDSARLIQELDEDITTDLRDLHDQVEALKDCHGKLADKHDTLSGAHAEIVEKQIVIHTLLADRKAVYVPSSDLATCSACKAQVARYFTRGTDVVCANCDPKTFAELSKG